MRLPFAGRRGLVGLAVATAALAVCSSAWAHAKMSPPVAPVGDVVYTLAVPTEEEDATTTKIEMSVPEGFDIDAFMAAPGWTREVEESAPASGAEHGDITKVTWSGGSVPHEEATNLEFIGGSDNAGDYAFKVKQTYSNGKVVDWSGDESADDPAPVVQVVSDLGGGGSSNTLAIIALILGGLGLVVGAAAFLMRGSGGGGARSLT